MYDDETKLKLYFARVRPLIRELFSMAHAICGNYDRAETALKRALSECWRNMKRGMTASGLRERLRKLVVHASMTLVGGEVTWTGFVPDAIDGFSSDPVIGSIESLSDIDKRFLLLKYGCGLSQGAIKKVLKSAQPSFNGVRTSEKRLKDICLNELKNFGATPPDAGSLFRSLELSTAEVGKGSKIASAVFSKLFFVIAIVFIALLIWLVSAISKPAIIDNAQILAHRLFL